MSTLDSSGPGSPLWLPPRLQEIRQLLTAIDEPIYLVGGLVRDIMLGQDGGDLDLAVARHGFKTAFKIGDLLDQPAYILDRKRDVGRVVLTDTTVDVARFRGADLIADLLDRDFTINAMALPLQAMNRDELIDPSQGLADLRAGILRQVNAQSIERDPVRALRAIRLAEQFGCEIERGTWDAVKAAVTILESCSPERLRDELVKLLSLPRPGQALARLADSGMDQVLLLEKDVVSWRWLDQLADVEISLRSASSLEADLRLAFTDWRGELVAFWDRPVDGGYSGRLLLRLAGLLGGHSVEQAEVWLRRFRFSNSVIRHVRAVVGAEERLLALPAETPLTRRQIYRYFKGVGGAGLDIAVLALARLRAGGGPVPAALLANVAQLGDHYWHRHGETIAPAPLLRGDELMSTLDLKPGPEVGRLLELIEAAQAAGELQTKQDALALARANQGL